MRTTLLGFAIAVILALVTALVGPFFVDWGRYRGEFEARASRLTGLEFRVTGSIDARLLPTPTPHAAGHRVPPPGRHQQGARPRLRIGSRSARWCEESGGSRMRGSRDPSSPPGSTARALNLPAPSMASTRKGLDPRLSIEDGQAILADAASGSSLALDKIEFKGEVRSLAGPRQGRLVRGRRHHITYR